VWGGGGGGGGGGVWGRGISWIHCSIQSFPICSSTYATRGTLSRVHLMLQFHNNDSLIGRMLLKASFLMN